MKGFGIYVKNDLLEPKHVQQMGEAVWLYMWLLDKMTTVNENGAGKVLGNKPIKFSEIVEDLGVSRQTYGRWVDKLRATGYINTLRTPLGLIITVNKAKKGKATTPKSDVPKSSITKQKRVSDVPKSDSDVPYSGIDAPKSGIQYKTKQGQNKDKTINTTNVVLGDLKTAEYKEQVSKLYYEAIKALDIPVRNHNNLRSAISKMTASPDRTATIGYLEFMRDKFLTTEWPYKPHVTEALDIHDRRAKIRQTIKDATSVKPIIKGRGFRGRNK
jgi:hypothetical protein